MGLNIILSILQLPHWLPGMQFTYMFSSQQFTASRFYTRILSARVFLDASNKIPSQKLFSVEFIIVIISILEN